MEECAQLLINKEEKSCLAFVEGNNDNCSVTVFDDKSDEVLSKVQLFNFGDFDEFINSLVTKQFKAVIFEVFNYQSFMPLYQSNNEFCQALKAKFIQAKIPTFFITSVDWLMARILVFTNLRSRRNDIVSTVGIIGEEGVVSDFKYTIDGYQRMPPRAFKTPLNVDKIKEEILQNRPKTVVMINTGSYDLDQVKPSLSKSTNLINISLSDLTGQTIIQTLKQIIDKRCIHYKVLPTCLTEVIIRPKGGPCKCPLISADPGVELPFDKTIKSDKCVYDLVVTVKESASKEPVVIYSCTPDSKAHLHEVTLKIDEHNFVSFEVKPIICKQIKNLPTYLGKKKDLKIPVISLRRNLSFILVRKNDKSDYEFLQSWNSLYGTDLYLNFEQEKPTFCEKALQSKSNNLIYDITKVMSSPPQKSYEGHFEVTEDENNPILIKFINHEEKEKVASPSFMMALMLKEHFKAIKDELGEKPKKVGFIFHDNFGVVGSDSVEDQITEACEMLKVACDFIVHDVL